MKALMGEYYTFTEGVKTGGNYVTGAPLQPTQTATTVRVRDGATLTSHGPFAETREQLGGFYLLNCKDLDEAISLAAKIPGACDLDCLPGRVRARTRLHDPDLRFI
jgi:hypothetical protein